MFGMKKKSIEETLMEALNDLEEILKISVEGDHRRLVIDATVRSFIDANGLDEDAVNNKQLLVSWKEIDGLINIVLTVEESGLLVGQAPVIYLSETLWPDEVTNSPLNKKSFISNQLNVLGERDREEKSGTDLDSLMVSGNESIN